MSSRSLFILMALSLLTGCGVTVWEATNNLNCRYDGHNAKEFLQNYNLSFPVQPYHRPFHWVEASTRYPVPLGNKAEMPGGYIEFTEPPAGIERRYCTILIQADSQDIIQRMWLVNDSGGQFHSFCAKVFGKAATDCILPPNAACAAGACP